jgi:chitinase
MQSSVTGTSQSVTSAMPSGDSTLTWAFATGACGSENWGGITSAMIASNVATFVNAGKKYIVSTGGAAGAFTCSNNSSFLSFINTYHSANMIGVDFDIEDGQSAAQIAAIISVVKNAQSTYPNMRFSFTIATLATSQSGTSTAHDFGSSSPNPLGSMGITVMNAIIASGISNYYVDLMAMDYGAATYTNCVISGGVCEMGQSAIQAAMDLHGYYNIPYSKIEITPMSGANDTSGETFTVADVSTLSTWVNANGIAGVHFWSFDRDTTSLSYTNGFDSDL